MNDRETEIVREFNALAEPLRRWGAQVDSTIMSVLNDDFIKNYRVKITPKYRLKDAKSYMSKVLYRNKPYANPIVDVEDKIGTRVVLLTTDDVNQAADLLKSFLEWNVKTTKDLNRLVYDFPEVFNYQSIHLVVWPKETNVGYQEEIKEKLTCEIQLRTLLQHAYAEVSHDSTYKGPYRNDKEIMRHLAKSMALMEATDDYFCNIFKMMTDQQRKYRNFINELFDLFVRYMPEFTKEQVDYESTDYILELLSLKDVSVNDLEQFAVKYDSELRNVIRASNGHLFVQPIILLISYYFFKHKRFLKNNWNLSLEALRAIFAAYNTLLIDIWIVLLPLCFRRKSCL